MRSPLSLSLPLMIIGTILVAGLALTAHPAFAADDERFAIEKTKYGFVRLDKATGAMTFCREDDEQLTCHPATTEATSVEADVKALATRVDALEAQLKTSDDRAKALEDKLKAATSTPQFSVNGEHRLPTDKEVDEAFSFMEKLMKRFTDMNRTLDQEQGLPKKP